MPASSWNHQASRCICSKDVLWTRATSCYCKECFTESELQPSCDGWSSDKVNKSTASTSSKGKKTKKLQGNMGKPSDSSSSSSKEKNLVKSTSLPQTLTNERRIVPEIGDFVAAAYTYDSNLYIGKVEELDEEAREAKVNFMTFAKQDRYNMFKWPQTEDRIWIPSQDSLFKISTLTPTARSARLFKILDCEFELVNDIYTQSCKRVKFGSMSK